MDSVRINLIVLRSRDLPRAVEFYEQIGMRFTSHRHGTGAEHFAAVLAGTVFELYPQTPNGPSTLGTRLGLAVTSLESAIAALSDFPDAVASPPRDTEWGRRAVVVDPDGHRVELLQEAAQAP